MPWSKPNQPSRNRRLDPEIYQRTGQVCFITIRAYRNQQPFVSDGLNQMILDTLRAEQDRLACSIYTFCLMPDHLHYLGSPREDGRSIHTFTEQFKGKTTNRSWKLGWHGKLWQPRYYDHVVRAEEDLRALAEYILNNPMRKELAARPDEWQWCGHMNPLPL